MSKLPLMNSWQAKNQARRHKYGAKKQSFGGVIYDSKFEASYAEKLEWRRKAGEITDIKRQHKIDIRVNGKHWRDYLIDFRIELSDGRIEYIEVKGFPTKEWKQKWDLLTILKDEILEPNSELILVT